MYAEGHGVPQGYVAAYIWWSLAAAQGNETARENLGFVANRMTSTQIAKAQWLAQTYRIQRLLKVMGYNPGPVNGIMGEKTRAAIQQFQRDKGLPANGEPDDATLKAMNLK